MRKFHKLCALGMFVASGYVGATDGLTDGEHSLLGTPSEISKLDTPAQILALPPESIPTLNSEQTRNILISNLSKLSFEQACCLSMRDTLYNISPAMIEALPNKRIARMLSRRQLELRELRDEQSYKGVVLSEYAASLSLAQIGALTPEQHTLLVSGYVGAIDRLTNREYGLLCTPSGIGSLNIPEKIFALPPDYIPMLHSGQIYDILIPNLDKLSFKQACCLSIRTILHAISPEMIRALPNDRVAQMLSRRQLELRQLEKEHSQKGELLNKHVTSLSPAQIGALTPDQVVLLFEASPCALTPEQIRLLDRTQMMTLRCHYGNWSFMYCRAFSTLQRNAFVTRRSELGI